MKTNLLTKYMDIINCPLQELTLSQLYEYIKHNDFDITLDKAENIFVKSKKTKNKILVVAHLDRVLKKQPRLFRYEDCPERIYGAYGWDDRAGIISALELFNTGLVDLLFTTSEESGCAGAKRITPSKIKQYDLIFELDRHGNKDFINECSMGLLCNDVFTNDICRYIGEKGFVLKPTNGVYTDIGALRVINTKAQMFYMSCGYYHEHTEEEYLIPEELERAIEIATLIIEYASNNEIPVFVPEKKKPKDLYNKEYSRRDGYYYCPSCDDYFLEEELFHCACPLCGGEVEFVEIDGKES